MPHLADLINERLRAKYHKLAIKHGASREKFDKYGTEWNESSSPVLRFFSDLERTNGGFKCHNVVGMESDNMPFWGAVLEDLWQEIAKSGLFAMLPEWFVKRLNVFNRGTQALCQGHSPFGPMSIAALEHVHLYDTYRRFVMSGIGTNSWYLSPASLNYKEEDLIERVRELFPYQSPFGIGTTKLMEIGVAEVWLDYFLVAEYVRHEIYDVQNTTPSPTYENNDSQAELIFKFLLEYYCQNGINPPLAILGEGGEGYGPGAIGNDQKRTRWALWWANCRDFNHDEFEDIDAWMTQKIKEANLTLQDF